MAYRRLLNLLPKGTEYVFNQRLPHFQKPHHIISHAVSFHRHASNCVGRTARALHTSRPLMEKLLSVEELFDRRSLQEHLKKLELEYSECLQAVSGSVTEEQSSEDELRAKRTKVSRLAPLIQSIRELDNKQKELSETEMLLKGEKRNSLMERLWQMFWQ